jgi:hypothetical protein
VKKVFSISFVLLILTAMLHLTVATHYCCGNVAALKISLTGKLASCGMEECMEKDYPTTESHIFTHCCDDVVTFYSIDNNYTPSFPVVPDFYQYNLQVFNIPAGLPVHPSAGLTSLYTNVSPPDALMSTSVDLSDICIFRI